MNKIALAAACLLAFTIAPAAAQRVEQVHFARGASGTTVDSFIGEVMYTGSEGAM